MIFNLCSVLFAILLVLVSGLPPMPAAGGWGRLVLFVALLLLTIALMLTGTVRFVA